MLGKRFPNQECIPKVHPLKHKQKQGLILNPLLGSDLSIRPEQGFIPIPAQFGLTNPNPRSRQEGFFTRGYDVSSTLC